MMRKSSYVMLVSLAMVLSVVGFAASLDDSDNGVQDERIPSLYATSGDYDYEASFSDPNKVIITKYNGPDTEITFPEYIDGKIVIAIGEGSSCVFSDKDAITSVTIPNSVTTIDRYAFSECSKLESVQMSENTTHIGVGAFYRCSSLELIEIPSGVTTIDSQVFSGCSSLKSIEIPSGVTVINSQTFNGCSSLESIEIPSGVITIKTEAFMGCSSLESIEIPDSVTGIETGAFRSCSSLASIDIPNVTEIDNFTFYCCSSLASLDLSSLTKIGTYAFYECSELISLNIPNVTKIDEQAFYGCSKLVSVNMPDVSEIEMYAFNGCSKLASLDLPKIVRIKEDAFNRCSSLESVIIGEYANSILSGAFYNCSNLTFMKFLGNAPNVYSFSIPYNSNLIIYHKEDAIGFKGGVWESYAKAVIISDIIENLTAKSENTDSIRLQWTISEKFINDFGNFINLEYSVQYKVEGGSSWIEYDNGEFMKVTGTDGILLTKGNLYSLGPTEFKITAVEDFLNQSAESDSVTTSYLIKLKIDDGVDDTEFFVRYGDTILNNDNFADPYREGYKFVKWTHNNGDVPGHMPAEDITVKAVWNIIQYTVDFDDNGGDGGTVADIKKDFDDTVTVPAYGFTKTGYIQIGWNTAVDGSGTAYEKDDEFNMPAGGLTLYAVWEIQEYTITFDETVAMVMDGAAEISNGDAIVYGTILTVTAKPKTGYYSDVSADTGTVGTEGEYTVIGDVEFTVNYTLIKYTVIFDSAGGSPVDSVTQDYESVVSAPSSPIRDDFIFYGWYDADDEKVTFPFAMPLNGANLVAKWKIGISVPVGKELTYNGEEQFGVDSGEGYNLTGQSYINAGDSYVANATPCEGYVWVISEDGKDDVYSLDSEEIIWSIKKSKLIVTSKNETITFGSDEPDYTVRVEGLFETDEDMLYNYGLLTFSTGYDKESYVNQLSITFGGWDSAFENYYCEYVFGTLTINRILIDVPEANELVYNGKKQIGISEGTGYTLTKHEETDAGEYEATVTLLSGYQWNNLTGDEAIGLQYVDWNIIKAELSVTAVDETITFRDNEPGYSVNYEGFVNGEDRTILAGLLEFNVEYDKNSNVYKNKFDIIPYGLTSDNYEILFVKGTLSVDRILIDVPVAVGNLIYDGKVRTGVPEGTGYTLTGHKETNADSYEAIATPEEGHQWKDLAGDDAINPRTIAWDIEQFDISGISVTIGTDSFVYNITAHEPVPVIEITNFEKDRDYLVSYTDNINAGTATVTVTGTGNYKGTAEAEFVIGPADISVADVTVADAVFTGADREPLPVVTIGGKTLVESTDYTLSYRNNINAGTAEVTVTGTGNYKESVTAEFSIKSIEKFIEDSIDENDEPTVEINQSIAEVAIPSSVFEKLATDNKTLVIDVVDDENNILYSWTFGDDYDGDREIIFKPGIAAVTNPEEILNDAIDSAKVDNPLVLNFAASGEFPTTVSVKYYVGNSFENGTVLSLFYFNEESNELENQGQKLTVVDGYVTFALTHCSVYILGEFVGAGQPSGGSNALLYAGIVAAIAIIAFAAVVFIKRRM